MSEAALAESEVESAENRRDFTRASGLNIVGNVAKILVEGAIGLTFGSVALLADAAHSVADVVGSVVVFVWGRNVYAAPDETHPHGHQRIEPLSALFVGGTIIVLGLYLLYESASALFTGPTVTFSPWLIGGLLFALADMSLLYWYTTRVNKRVDSSALAALAVDSFNDIFTTLAALVGVVGVLFGYPFMDAAVGGLVSILVIYQGLKVTRENVTYLVGAAPSEAERQRIIAALRDHRRVEGVHDVAVFYDGTRLEVEAHVEVDGELTLVQAHDIETELIERLQAMDDVGDVHLHLDPAGIGEWKEARERRERDRRERD